MITQYVVVKDNGGDEKLIETGEAGEAGSEVVAVRERTGSLDRPDRTSHAATDHPPPEGVVPNETESEKIGMHCDVVFYLVEIPNTKVPLREGKEDEL